MSPPAFNMAVSNNRPIKASATPRRRPVPRPGDVLASGRSARADIHGISVVPAEAHTTVARYSDAIAQVRALAQRRHVDAWYTSDHTHYVRVARHRTDGDAHAVA